MLTIYGMNTIKQESFPNIVLYPSEVFDGIITPEQLNSDFSRRVITDIQKVDVMDTRYTTKQLLALNELHPGILATGTKNIIVCKYYPTDLVCRMGRMGENCYKWLMDIAEERDIGAACVHSLEFTDSDLRGRKVYFADIDKYASNADEFFNCMCDLIGTGCFVETEEEEIEWLRGLGYDT